MKKTRDHREPFEELYGTSLRVLGTIFSYDSKMTLSELRKRTIDLFEIPNRHRILVKRSIMDLKNERYLSLSKDQRYSVTEKGEAYIIDIMEDFFEKHTFDDLSIELKELCSQYYVITSVLKQNMEEKGVENIEYKLFYSRVAGVPLISLLAVEKLAEVMGEEKITDEIDGLKVFCDKTGVEWSTLEKLISNSPITSLQSFKSKIKRSSRHIIKYITK